MKLLAINARDALEDPAFCKKLAGCRADVIVVSEAFAFDDSTYEASAEKLRSVLSGYRVLFVPYNDTDKRKDRHVLAMLVRKELAGRVKLEKLWLETRYAVVATVDDHWKIVGIHLNDRHNEGRNQQVQCLLDYLGDQPAVVLGDFNESWPGTFLGWLLWTPVVGRQIKKLPIGEPGTDQSRKERLGSLLFRLAMQVAGAVMETMHAARFQDADRSQRATKYLSRRMRFRVVQLDHILVRGLRSRRFRLFRPYKTDHAGVMAEVDIR